MDVKPKTLARIHAFTNCMSCKIADMLLHTAGAYIAEIAYGLNCGENIVYTHARELSDNGYVLMLHLGRIEPKTRENTYVKPTYALYDMARILERIQAGEV